MIKNKYVEAKTLSKKYQIGNNNYFFAVSNVSLEIAAGEIIIISGPNGSGKTTLLSMLGGMIRPSSGSISIMNNLITEMDQKTLTSFRKKNIGFIFQTFRLIDSLTVIENVEIVLNLNGMKFPESFKKAEALLNGMNILHKSKVNPDVLSGGEKQKVAIARAIANNPSVILADEPTGSLDSQAGKETIELLYQIAKEDKKAVIIVSHDSRIFNYADRLFQMEDGVIKY
ncbi:ABC transporter ATP-binding protein [Dolichospermum sp. ST_sed3]|nr:ABC transporter ATP-binding protein [Dolichospermum sp. ST_sed3]